MPFPSVAFAVVTGAVTSEYSSIIRWLLVVPVLYVIGQIVLLIRYRGWSAFIVASGEDDRIANSPWANRQFITEQYQKYCKHREKLKRIIQLKGHVDARERRHEYILRDLIDTKQFDHAEAYLLSLINLIRDSGDVDGEITYLTYMDRMRQFEAEAKAEELKAMTPPNSTHDE
ncbi:hypothetical protein J7K50_09525 [bacterium]|nr:hypothetical protein [bacterium]